MDVYYCGRVLGRLAPLPGGDGHIRSLVMCPDDSSLLALCDGGDLYRLDNPLLNMPMALPMEDWFLGSVPPSEVKRIFEEHKCPPGIFTLYEHNGKLFLYIAGFGMKPVVIEILQGLSAHDCVDSSQVSRLAWG